MAGSVASGVLAMKENDFLASYGFISVALTRLPLEDGISLARRTVTQVTVTMGFLEGTEIIV